MAEKNWKKFEKEIKTVVTNVDTSVLKKLRITFMITPLEFLISKNCIILVKDTIDKISHDKAKVYKHLLDFKKCLKDVTKNKTKAIAERKEYNKRQRIIDDEKSDDNLLVTVKDEEKEFLSYYNVCTPELSNTITINKNQSKSDLYISRLENILQSTKKEIERLEEDELTLDDLDKENNSFMMLDKLKSHSIKVWRKLSKLKKTSSRLHTRQTFSFKGTIHPQLNTNVEEFIKAKKFPDYHDIKSLVIEYFKEQSMNERKLRDLSQDIFIQIGNQLKKLRIKEFVNYFGNHLTDGVKESENPILHDEDLKRILVRNYNIGQIKMDEVLDKYSKLEQGNINRDEMDESDISTEHSEISDDEEIEDNLEEITFEDLYKQPLEEVFEEYDEEDSIEDGEHLLKDCNDQFQAILSESNQIQNKIELESTQFVGNNVNDILNNNNDFSYEFNGNEFSLISNVLTPDQDAEAQIKEMEAHTFKFNIEQMRQGPNTAFFPTIINIDSSEESNNSDSEEDVPDFEENNFAYSSKLDDFCIVKMKKKDTADTGICITLDDSDDCDS